LEIGKANPIYLQRPGLSLSLYPSHAKEHLSLSPSLSLEARAYISPSSLAREHPYLSLYSLHLALSLWRVRELSL